MQKATSKAAEFFPTEALGKPAEVLAGYFLPKTPVDNKGSFLRSTWEEAGFASKAPLFLKQVHSGIAHSFLNGAAPTTIPTGDAALTDSKEVFLIIQVADCLPVLFFDSLKKLVAGAHAGWKGSLLGIVPEVVRRFTQLGSNPADVRVWLGPSIRSCCYEVDVERSVLLPRRDGSARHIDLVVFNRQLLEKAGINPSAIHIDPRCTACASEKLPSYRREGEKAGRLFAFVALG